MGSQNDSIKRVKMTLQVSTTELYRSVVSTQKKSIENDSLEGVVLGSRKRLLWRSQNDSFKLTVTVHICNASELLLQLSYGGS